MTARAGQATSRAAGEAARVASPPAALGDWSAAPGRPDPVALLEQQDASRIPELVPVRYGRMAISPFTFLRGAALPMAADLCAGPSSGVVTQLCGDAHLANFGLFASPERDLLFDVNDFDETLRGPFEFDLKRLAASLVVAGRARGFGAHDTRHIVRRAIRSYRDRMAGYATMRAIDVYYARVDATAILAYVTKRERAMIEGTVRSTAHHDAVHELPRLTAVVDGVRRLVEHPPTLVRRPDATPPLAASVLAEYRETLQEDRRLLLDRYAMTDFALKVVGVGSVGPGRLHRAVHGRHGGRPAVPPGEAGRGVGLRAIPCAEPRGEPRRAGGHRPASPAGRQRHPARLGGR